MSTFLDTSGLATLKNPQNKEEIQESPSSLSVENKSASPKGLNTTGLASLKSSPIIQIENKIEQEATHLQSLERGYLQNRLLLNRTMFDDEEAELIEQRLKNLPRRRYESFKDIKSGGDLWGYAVEGVEEQASTLLGLAGITLAPALLGASALTTMGTMAVGLGSLHFGESRQSLIDQGFDPAEVDVEAVPAATINTALDVVGLKKITTLLGLGKYLGLEGKVNKLVGDTLKKKIIKHSIDVNKAAAIEGSIEVTQDTVNELNAALWADEEVRGKILEGIKDGDAKLETFLRAYSSTLLIGAGGKVISPKDKKKEDDFKEDPLSGKKDKEEKKPEDTLEENVDKENVEEENVDIIEEPPEGEVNPVVGKTKPEDQDSLLVVEENTEAGPVYTVTDLKKQNAKTLEDAQDFIQSSLEEFDSLETNLQDLKLTPGETKFIKGKITKGIGNILNGSYLTNTFTPKNIDYYTDVAHEIYTTKDNATTLEQINATGRKGVYSNLQDTTVWNKDKVGLKLPETMAQAIEKMATVFQAQYLPDNNIFLSIKDGSFFDNNAIGAHVAQYTGKDGLFSVIEINADATSFQELIDKYGLESTQVTESVMSDVAHELSHAMLAAQVKTMPIALRKALIRQYVKDVKKIFSKEMNLDTFFKSRFSPSMYSRFIDGFRKETLNAPAINWLRKIKSADYMLNLEEYFAEKVSAAFLNPQLTKQVAGLNYLQKALHLVNTFLVKHFGVSKGTNIYEKVLETIRKKVAIEKDLSHEDKTKFQEDLKNTLGIGEIIQMPDAHIWSSKYDRILAADYPDFVINTTKHISEFDKEYRISTGFNRWKAYILSPSQIARRYRFSTALDYMKEVGNFAATKMQGISRADELAKAWNSLSSTMGENLSKYLFKLSEVSDEKRRKLTPGEKKILAEQFKLSEEVQKLAEEIEHSFAEVLRRTRAATEKDIAKTFVHDPEGFLKAYRSATNAKERAQVVMAWVAEDESLATSLLMELGQVNQQFTHLENKNYFPRMRFGDFLVIVKETDEWGKEGRTVTYEAFETKSEYQARLLELQNQYRKKDSGFKVRGVLLDDTAKSLWGMPQIVVDRVEKALKTVGAGLTREQQEALKAIALDLSPGKRHLRQMKKRMHVKGASKDGIRTYATYMSNASNHLARVEHATELVERLREIEKQPKLYEGDNTDLSAAASYYREHFKYIMNPENDLAALRNIGFLWYLGFNVKSALVNLSQLPMVTYPWLASRYGDIAATSSLMKAMTDISAHWITQKKFSQEEQAMLDQLERDGITNESQAMELSSLSNSTVLARMTKSKGLQRSWGQFTYAAGWMFSAMEGYNRKVNALAAYRLAKSAGNNHQEATQVATDSVRQTQFEYAKWDRAELMRGKKSAALLFMNYTQNFLYTAFNGDKNAQGRATMGRMLVVMLLVAGLQGLPGSEYFLSMVDFLGTYIKKMFGMKDPKVESRKWLREYLNQAFEDPWKTDLLLHGASRYGFGSGLIAEQLMGSPIDLDLSGSLSMGAPLQFGRTTTREGYQFKDFLQEATGPIGNVVANAWQAGTSQDPDTWKKAEKLLPVAFKNVSKGIRYYDRGKETFKGGGQFAEMDNNYENFFQALGFTPTQLAQKREMFGEQMASSMYWKNRRNYLITQYILAIEIKDYDGVKDAKEEIKSFNASLQSKETRAYMITGKELAESRKTRLKNNRKKEAGLPLDKRDKGIFKNIEDSYPSR